MFSGRLWNIFIDSFPKMLLRALTGTIPLTVIAFALAMVIAVVVALVQFANVKVLKSFCLISGSFAVHRFWCSCILYFLDCQRLEFYSIHFLRQ